MTTPQDNNGYDDGYNDDDYYSSDQDPNPETQVIYNGAGYGSEYDDTQTQVYGDYQEQAHQEWMESGNYDFTLDNLIDQYKSQFDYNNLPRGHKYNDWVAKSDYDGLYGALLDVSDVSQDTIGSLYQQYQELSSRAQEKETAINSLKTQVSNLTKRESASNSYNESKKRELEDQELALEYQKKKHKGILYGSIGVAVVMSLLTLTFVLMWQGAKSDSQSEEERSSAHQERISDLESSLQSSRSDLSNAQSRANDLENKLDSANKRADDAEKAIKDVRGQVEERDKALEELNKDIEELRNDPVTSTTTVTQTPDSRVVTSTITAPPSAGEPTEDTTNQGSLQ